MLRDARFFFLAGIGLFLASSLDAFSTLAALSSSVRNNAEANPLMDYLLSLDPALFVFFKAVLFPAIFTGIAYRFRRFVTRNVFRIIFGIPIALFAFFALSNARLAFA